MSELIFHNSDFEWAARKALEIYDRPLTSEDALRVEELDLTFGKIFCTEDIGTLCEFRNLKSLYIEAVCSPSEYLSRLPKLEILLINYLGIPDFDFEWLTCLENLCELSVIGSICSDQKVKNTESLAKLPRLDHLGLKDLGELDLSFLRLLPNLNSFFCGWIYRVSGVEAIGTLTGLSSLELDAITIPNLDFLESLSPDTYVELCGIRLTESGDLSVLERFRDRDVEEIECYGDGGD